MNLNVIKGNIFTSNCQTIVNTVNCVGAMGAGIALECRLRYPDMYTKYIHLCYENKMSIGKLWIYKSQDRWILNFPTKTHWKYPSKSSYLHAGLEKFVATYKDRGVTSIAFPLLGADNGGIPQEESLAIMKSYLEKLDINVEIYKYLPDAEDDLYKKTKSWLLSQEVDYISKSTGIGKNYVIKVLSAMQSSEIHQLNQLGKVQGVGIKTLEKIFNFSKNSISHNHDTVKQQTLL
jgi:O-acetyl-ADP-ribose deacetylase (regulator of RNase III)